MLTHNKRLTESNQTAFPLSIAMALNALIHEIHRSSAGAEDRWTLRVMVNEY